MSYRSRPSSFIGDLSLVLTSITASLGTGCFFVSSSTGSVAKFDGITIFRFYGPAANTVILFLGFVLSTLMAARGEVLAVAGCYLRIIC